MNNTNTIDRSLFKGGSSICLRLSSHWKFRVPLSRSNRMQRPASRRPQYRQNLSPLAKSRRTPAEKLLHFVIKNGVLVFGALAGLFMLITIRASISVVKDSPPVREIPHIPKLPFQKEDIDALPNLPAPGEIMQSDWDLPAGFQAVLDRAKQNDDKCQTLETTFSGYDDSSEVEYQKEMIATLPSMGIVQDLEEWNLNPGPSDVSLNSGTWHCKLPPATECQETKFTIVFMAYNPDRLGKTMKEIRHFLEDPEWTSIVEEVIITWNGERHVGESKDGQYVLKYSETHNLRIVYPLQMGFPNDLMNRYHPEVVRVKTKAILYYDDDGPFYSVDAVRAGFELWKRHSSVQIGAMARQLDYCPRQKEERKQLDPEPNDTLFVSHCTNVDDKIDYNFRYFANYDANMVLPSGSFLHSNYLCFLWHPVLERIREFIRAHPVHPDDITVSTIVSHLAGKAPRVYSRRLNKPDKRRLSEADPRIQDQSDYDQDLDDEDSTEVYESALRHRRLMHGIDWDAGAGMNDAKRRWADLRTIAINALVRYFGSINSGSIGWCPRESEWYDAKTSGRCKPIMAKQGMLEWMNKDNTPKGTCP